MKCPNCKRTVYNDDTFCKKCGHPLYLDQYQHKEEKKIHINQKPKKNKSSITIFIMLLTFFSFSILPSIIKPENEVDFSMDTDAIEPEDEIIITCMNNYILSFINDSEDLFYSSIPEYL